jgi:hypothetical protein
MKGHLQVKSYNSFYINLTVLAIVPPALANTYFGGGGGVVYPIFEECY